MPLIDKATFDTDTTAPSLVATKRSSPYSYQLCTMSYYLGVLHEEVAAKNAAKIAPTAQRLFYSAQRFLEENGKSTNPKTKKACEAVEKLAEGAWVLSKENAKAVPKNMSGVIAKPEDYDTTKEIKEKACTPNGFTADKWYSQMIDVRALSLYITSNVPDDKDPLTHGGWCVGMVTYWIMRDAVDGKDDYWKWALTDEAASAFRAQAARQAHSGKTAKERLAGPTNALKNKKLEVSPEKQFEANNDAKRIAYTTAALADKGWHLLVMGGNGAHAMGLYVGDDKKVTFFDPNFGQWTGPADKFTKFFTAFYKAAEYAFTVGYDVVATKP
jgi:hypothetical protein